ncbi:MAG: AraC family transcriptional regulator [Anaerolineae bacterium]|nr:AraC family transcriptional regulator [Anaerolineae bacterium]
MHIREGFAGQLHFVVPRPFLQEVENHPLLRALFVTDIGWYPAARYHYRERETGSAEYILIYCVAGRGFAQVGGAALEVGPGQALLIPSGEAHLYSASVEAPWSIHWVHFRGETAYQFLQQLPPGQLVMTVDPRAHGPITETFQECYAALAEGFSTRQMIFCALALHRIFGWLFFANPAFQPGKTALPRSIDRTLAYLRDHLDQRPSLAEMAAQAGLSVSHFSYLFKAHLGVAPIDYFIQLKIRYACHLLETSDLCVKDIAACLAYEDPYYFSRLFRKAVGCSPTQYRDRVR